VIPRLAMRLSTNVLSVYLRTHAVLVSVTCDFDFGVDRPACGGEERSREAEGDLDDGDHGDFVEGAVVGGGVRVLLVCGEK